MLQINILLSMYGLPQSLNFFYIILWSVNVWNENDTSVKTKPDNLVSRLWYTFSTLSSVSISDSNIIYLINE